MALTLEERTELVRQRTEAKLRCREVWSVVEELRRILRTYEADYSRWSNRFRKADLKLAEEDKLTIVTGKKKEVDIAKFTSEQIAAIAAILKLDLDKEDEDGT